MAPLAWLLTVGVAVVAVPSGVRCLVFHQSCSTVQVDPDRRDWWLKCKACGQQAPRTLSACGYEATLGPNQKFLMQTASLSDGLPGKMVARLLRLHGKV